MTLIFKPGISTWDHIQETAQHTATFFAKSPELHARANSHLEAVYEIADLVPENERRLGSGHLFPYSESYRELEGAALLAGAGFYRQGFGNLRTSIELALVGVYKDRNDQADVEMEAWLHSQEKQLNVKKMLREMRDTPSFEKFFSWTNFHQVIVDTYDNLGGFVHVRGFPYSSRRLSGANFNTFSQEVLEHFVAQLCHASRCIVILILLKYPWGVEPLPIWAKFGLMRPLGGFLDEGARARVITVLEPLERESLTRICREDPKSQAAIRDLLSLPDLSDEEIQRQVVAHRKADA